MRIAPLCLVAVMAASPALARDADSIVFGSQLDAIAEYADDLSDAADDQSDNAAPASAPDGEDRVEQRQDVISGENEPNSDSSGDDGSELEFTLRQGYDTNYEESSDPEGTSFTEIEGSATWAKEAEGGGAYLGAGLTALRLHDLDWKERGEGFVDVAFRKQIRSGLAVQGGIGLSLDATSDPYEGAGRATIGVEGLVPDAAWGLRLNVNGERALHARDPDPDEPARTYDFVRPEVEATVLFKPDLGISPYVTASLSRSEFPLDLPSGLLDDDGVEIPSPLRDATQGSIAAGLRLKPTDDVTVRLGLRGIMRAFDQNDIPSMLRLGPEFELEWQVTPQLTASAEAGRSIGEPDELGALAEDTRSVSGKLTYSPTDKLELEASGSFERSSVYGVSSKGDEVTAEFTATYKMLENAALLLSFYQLWYFDRIGDDDYERSRVSVGGTVTF